MFKDDFITVSRAHHLALKTQRAYWFQARKYIRWMGAKSAKDLEQDSTENFRRYLSGMANSGDQIEGDEGVSASSQNSAFHALRFLYEKVVGISLGDLSNIPRATGHQRIVDVPDDATAKRLVESVPGKKGIALRLIYGTAGRLNDILRLRLKDFDFKKKLVAIQESKGGKSRLVPMPESLIGELAALVRERERIHQVDLVNGLGWVHMPGRLAKKYPNEEKSLGWQYAFESGHTSKDPITLKLGRHHIQDVTLQRAFADACKKLKIKRHYTIHGLRHSTAQFWERNGITISEIAGLLGHSDIETTHRYLKSGVRGVTRAPSPI